MDTTLEVEVPGTRALRVTDDGRRGFLQEFALNLG